MLPKENGSVIKLKDAEGEKEISTIIDQFKNKSFELLQYRSVENFKASPTTTLEICANDSIDLPSMRLRNNIPVTQHGEYKKAYTYTDVFFEKEKNTAALSYGALIFDNMGRRSAWSTNENQPRVYDPEFEKLTSKLETEYQENISGDNLQFEKIIAGVAKKELKNIIKVFKSISKEDIADEYGRTRAERIKDIEINKQTRESASELFLYAERDEFRGIDHLVKGISEEDKKICIFMDPAESTYKEPAYRTLIFEIDRAQKIDENEDYVVSIDQYRLTSPGSQLFYSDLKMVMPKKGDTTVYAYPSPRFDSLASQKQEEKLLQMVKNFHVSF